MIRVALTLEQPLIYLERRNCTYIAAIQFMLEPNINASPWLTIVHIHGRSRSFARRPFHRLQILLYVFSLIVILCITIFLRFVNGVFIRLSPAVQSFQENTCQLTTRESFTSFPFRLHQFSLRCPSRL